MMYHVSMVTVNDVPYIYGYSNKCHIVAVVKCKRQILYNGYYGNLSLYSYHGHHKKLLLFHGYHE